MPRGSAVSLNNVNSVARKSIKKQLEDHGYQVVNNAPFEFRTSVSKGAKTTRTYRDVTGGADETVTMQSEIYELALYHDEEKIWYRGGGNDPGNFVQLDDGETVQGRINKGKGSADGFFNSILIPDVFVKTPKGYFHGTSSGLDEF